MVLRRLGTIKRLIRRLEWISLRRMLIADRLQYKDGDDFQLLQAFCDEIFGCFREDKCFIELDAKIISTKGVICTSKNHFSQFYCK
jgi:hypothetical protein